MSVMPWTDISADRYDAESPIDEALLADHWKRAESLISGPLDLRFAEVSHNTTTATTKATLRPYIVAAAGTDGGARCTLRFVFEARVTTGTGVVRARLGASGTWQSVNVTGATYARFELVISAADVNAAKGTEAAFEVQLQAPSGGTIYARNLWGSASRLERAA